MRLRLTFAVFLVPTTGLFAVTVYCWPVIAAHARAPEKTLQLFYMGDHEPELADPLIFRKMPLRRLRDQFPRR